MKPKNQLLKNHQPKQQLRLFEKLLQNKKNKSINEVSILSSKKEEDYSIQQQRQEYHTDINLIKQRLVEFKEQKAREIVQEHKSTNESIESIVTKMRDNLQFQALCIIKSDINIGFQRKLSQGQDLGSTLPNSVEEKNYKSTPRFDSQTYKSKKKNRTIDLGYRQFTLGKNATKKIDLGMH